MSLERLEMATVAIVPDGAQAIHTETGNHHSLVHIK